jgi:acyl transferase domain-containing protein
MTMIAIVGMALRFPGANDAHEFWENLRRGVDSIARLAESELRDAGVHSTLLRDPRYVRARGTLRDEALFDADFFNMSSREAALTDPQHRLFLECAWEALERAGYDPARVENPIGLFAGAGSDGYLRHHIVPAGLPVDGISGLEASLGNDRDYLATRVAYKLNLRGPSISVQTACSTSLVAVQLACQSLLGYQCDMALAGGVSLAFPLHEGYLHQPGHILSSDGRCRAFDAEADGPVSGDGVGVVVLKRLEDASADGDHIHAIILASAVNNDGSLKAGYSAPGERGQAEAIALAHAIAGVSARSISYVEAHGTGTPLGDPIEIAALTRAFRATTPERGFCALGSVKTNIGHLNTAAGVASLIKAALSVERGEIPASLHFRNPNPQIEFEKTPFLLIAELSRWTGMVEFVRDSRDVVCSCGIGGTIVYVILL